MTYNAKRVQTTLTETEYRYLTRLSGEIGKPLSALVREAIEQVYFERKTRARRRSALKKLLALNAPVADWQQMEQEIIRGATER
ncbi:MAG: hypothetical protein HZC40_02485 [Chloroflexi bacterium]|nr:hypothetical protein [Chloroflexota bacterium]